ncbi:MAG: hypothetical protein COA78_12065 [Blastopirellula sp.]|nr:MAG: hypothetical protein COA78_12065 [Blastopirellula sp.]
MNELVETIINNLCGRSGFDEAFDVDEEILDDIKDEMLITITKTSIPISAIEALITKCNGTIETLELVGSRGDGVPYENIKYDLELLIKEAKKITFTTGGSSGGSGGNESVFKVDGGSGGGGGNGIEVVKR